MALSEHLDRIATATGQDRAAIVQQFQDALLAAAREAWGSGRELETMYDDGATAVSMYQVVHVVEQVDPARPFAEIDPRAAEAIGGELGDELLIQIFYRDEDLEAAIHQTQLFSAIPSLETLAPGLPLPAEPTWLAEIWPHRRRKWTETRA